MKVEHPNALRFILQDEIYLLDEDKSRYQSTASIPAEPVVASQPEIKTPQVNFNYLGANKKNFLILTHYTDHDFMAEAHLTALESVLSRLGHTREDAAILNMAKHEAYHDLLLSHFKPKTIVILGKASIPAGMQVPQLNAKVSEGNISLLYTFSFDEMMTNNDNKKVFWEQMKSL